MGREHYEFGRPGMTDPPPAVETFRQGHHHLGFLIYKMKDKSVAVSQWSLLTGKLRLHRKELFIFSSFFCLLSFTDSVFTLLFTSCDKGNIPL
jgi:hypothetical protein